MLSSFFSIRETMRMMHRNRKLYKLQKEDFVLKQKWLFVDGTCLISVDRENETL